MFYEWCTEFEQTCQSTKDKNDVILQICKWPVKISKNRLFYGKIIGESLECQIKLVLLFKKLNLCQQKPVVGRLLP